MIYCSLFPKCRSLLSVRAEIIRCSDSQFDPDIAKIMIQMIDDDKDYKMNEQGGAIVWNNPGNLKLIAEDNPEKTQ